MAGVLKNKQISSQICLEAVGFVLKQITTHRKYCAQDIKVEKYEHFTEWVSTQN
jgi:hypothetical protein